MEKILNAYTAQTGCLHIVDPALCVLGEKRIPHEARNVASARRFVQGIAIEWNTAEAVPEIAELLTSEIVTNTIVHGATSPTTAPPVHITVMREGKLMMVETCDSSSAIPRTRNAAPMEISGRGLTVVRELAHNWGWLPHPNGKSVWFELVAWP
ncbi:ATP-binding protein [Streptosporangium sp. NPDC000239]|uniref:ATP-binding protein n=1 Tax=Streptosporangium sp. NPDC000239 TaxID=3154248 RepID=UPI00332E52DA